MMSENSTFHVCNSVTALIPKFRELGSSWEDRNLEGLDKADYEFEWLSKYAPGVFVLIDTGDSIRPQTCLGITKNSCQWSHNWHHDCETYDPWYRKLLVPRVVWEQCAEPVLKADRLWRIEKSYCFDVLTETDYWWWLDEVE